MYIFHFEDYKTLASHLLECLSSEFYAVLFSICDRDIKRLVVRQHNTMASIMAVLCVSQAIPNYIARLRTVAGQCD